MSLSAQSKRTGTEPEKPIALVLGGLVRATQYDDLPRAAVAAAKRGILDCLAVTLAGSRERPVERLMQALAPMNGASAVFGRRRRASSLDAALINGTASHALDFDDLSTSMKGHPSGPVLSALFALADETPVTGKAVLLAYVVGVEAEGRLGRALNPAHQAQGWHPTGTLGVFGAAAACAKLLDLSAEQTARALATATSLSSGLKANFGTSVKPLHSGHAARNGLLAAKLARTNFDANDRALEHRHGFVAAYSGLEAAGLSRGIAAWGDPFEMIDPGLVFKQYPCCASIHPALDAVLALIAEHAFEAAQVERVDVWLDAKRLDHTNRPRPATSLDAKFSVQYCVARALADRAVLVRHFEEGAQADSDIAALLPRIHAAPCVAGSWLQAHPYGAAVRVILSDGRELSSQIPQALGREPAAPLSDAHLRRKFFDCCRVVLEEGAIAELEKRIQALDDVIDVSDITTLASAGA